jgi:mannose/fructose/N-acetylgalactosamine-specific phosphotransferase system component IID
VWPISLTADLFGVVFRGYSQGVALIPKVKVSGKPAGILAVIAAVIGLAVIPILAVAAMVLAGVAWKDAPRWTRVTLLVGAVLYVAYRVGVSHPAVHHG